MHAHFTFVILLILFSMSQIFIKTAAAKSVSVKMTSLQTEQKEGRRRQVFKVCQNAESHAVCVLGG